MIGDPPVRAIENAIGRLSDDACAELRDVLRLGEFLVPCPPSAPFPPKQKPALWVPLRICEALRAVGYGGAVLPCIDRVEAVPKSAFAAPGKRPTVARHMESMRVHELLDSPKTITLVDDVVTKGATLFAAASLLATAFPAAEIRAFALIRTMGFVPNVDRIVDPVVGQIYENRWGNMSREP